MYRRVAIFASTLLLALRLEAKVSPKVALFAGVRTLEGGADNDEVYRFAWFAYAIGGVAIRF